MLNADRLGTKKISDRLSRTVRYAKQRRDLWRVVQALYEPVCLVQRKYSEKSRDVAKFADKPHLKRVWRCQWNNNNLLSDFQANIIHCARALQSKAWRSGRYVAVVTGVVLLITQVAAGSCLFPSPELSQHLSVTLLSSGYIFSQSNSCEVLRVSNSIFSFHFLTKGKDFYV